MPVKHITVALAGLGPSICTLKYAIFLAKVFQAKLTAVHVVNRNVLQELLKSRVLVTAEAREYEHDMEEQARHFMEKVKKLAESKNVACDGLILYGSVSDEITSAARDLQADLLVMGEMKQVLSRRETFYSEGEHIIRSVACPILIAKNPQEIEKLFKEI